MSLANTTFLDACRGTRPAHTPIWVMRQAGRYLPEYREVRSKVSFEELCRRPDLCAEVTRQPIDRFGLDAAILFSDILTVFDAMGAEVEFTPAPVVAQPVRTAADVARLRFGKADDHLGYVYDAVSACKKELADRVPLIGFCGAPFTTASYLVEGGGSKEFFHTKSMAFTEPALFGRLLESITTVLVDYLAGQVRAGVDALQIFESWGSALAPEDYRAHVLPHLARLVAEAKGHGVPVIVFVRGNASLLEQAKTLGADVMGIDWSIELSRAIEVVGTDQVVQGNLDPMALFATPQELERRARAIVEAGRRARAHVFNLGHGISRFTDPDAVARLVAAVHAA
ncbi:uroporphyrinogen decarboxylase [Paraliomyxa miuraensis]|uniref:uroporphyrinogen decarboxylase n=1 Tax=Paraliomyxa miuraensis TaxID=376150 RepID=UPI00224D9586|nr:uroporphyrinogen decarboxylase [Paraliomyxa miuraensis]MCX4246992.1 uroporphyrinogen decarboxylase [Paraliomyxa miuraensis]